jgi:hypothetical protein
MEFYDDNGDKVAIEENWKYVEKNMEQLMTKDKKDKDLHPPGPRKIMLYLGDKETFEKPNGDVVSKFEDKYKRLMTLKREEFNYVKEIKKK